MARHRKIDTGMWGDEKFRSLTRPRPNAQSLWIFILTGPHTTAAPGLFCAGEAGLAEALAWPLRSFRRHFGELEARGMVRADWGARVVWVPRALRYNPPESANVVRAWRKAIADIPECQLRDEAESYLREGCLFPEVFDEEIRTDKRGRLRVGDSSSAPKPPKAEAPAAIVAAAESSGHSSTEAPGKLAAESSGNGDVLFPEAFHEDRQEGIGEAGTGTGAGPGTGEGNGGARRARPAPSPRQLLEVWNANRGALAAARELSPGREKAARSRLKAYPDLERWAAAVRRLASKPHLVEQSWVTLDFLLKPDSLTRIEEGRYDRAFGRGSDRSSITPPGFRAEDEPPGTSKLDGLPVEEVA